MLEEVVTECHLGDGALPCFSAPGAAAQVVECEFCEVSEEGNIVSTPVGRARRFGGEAPRFAAVGGRRRFRHAAVRFALRV